VLDKVYMLHAKPYVQLPAAVRNVLHRVTVGTGAFSGRSRIILDSAPVQACPLVIYNRSKEKLDRSSRNLRHHCNSCNECEDTHKTILSSHVFLHIFSQSRSPSLLPPSLACVHDLSPLSSPSPST